MRESFELDIDPASISKAQSSFQAGENIESLTEALLERFDECGNIELAAKQVATAMGVERAFRAKACG